MPVTYVDDASLPFTDITTNGASFVDQQSPLLFAAATDLKLTAAAGVFSSGVVRWTVHYIDFTPATS